MGNVNLTPEQLSKLGSHLEQKETQGGFDEIVSVDESEQSLGISNQPQQRTGSMTELQRRIKELEKDYYGGGGISKPVITSDTYRDEFGNETFYVKNVSNGHVALSDLEVVVRQGQVYDLTQLADLEKIHQSKELKQAMQSTGGNSAWLVRLTQKEYLEELEKAALMRKKIEAVRQQDALRKKTNQQQPINSPFQNPPVQEEQPHTRPVILAKLEKLRLSFDQDPEISKYGISPVQFIQWIMSESFTEEELNEILGNPIVQKNHDIKAAIVEKMTIM